MSLHRQRTHPVEVEGCFGCKISALQLSPGEASTRTTMSTKKWDGELQAYRDARAQGIRTVSGLHRTERFSEFLVFSFHLRFLIHYSYSTALPSESQHLF